MLIKEETIKETITRETNVKYYERDEKIGDVYEIFTKESLLRELRELEEDIVVEEVGAYFKAFYKLFKKFPNMTITEHSVLCFLMTCEAKEGYSYYNEGSLAETFNMSQKGICKIVESLSEKNFITRFFCSKNGIQRIIKVNRRFIYCGKLDEYKVLKISRGQDDVLFFEKSIFYDEEINFNGQKLKGLIRIPYKKLEKFLQEREKIVFDTKFNWKQFLLEANYKTNF